MRWRNPSLVPNTASSFSGWEAQVYFLFLLEKIKTKLRVWQRVPRVSRGIGRDQGSIVSRAKRTHQLLHPKEGDPAGAAGARAHICKTGLFPTLHILFHISSSLRVAQAFSKMYELVSRSGCLTSAHHFINPIRAPLTLLLTKWNRLNLLNPVLPHLQKPFQALHPSWIWGVFHFFFFFLIIFSLSHSSTQAHTSSPNFPARLRA